MKPINIKILTVIASTLHILSAIGAGGAAGALYT